MSQLSQEEFRMYAHFLRLADPERFTSDVWHGYQLKNRFGLTIEDYKKLLKEQNDRCAICDRTIEEVSQDTGAPIKRLAVDHDKKSGSIRGLLCASCNQAIGLLNHSPRRLRNALFYLTPLTLTEAETKP